MTATWIRRFNQMGRRVGGATGLRFCERRRIEASVTHAQLERFAGVHPYALNQHFRGRRA